MLDVRRIATLRQSLNFSSGQQKAIVFGDWEIQMVEKAERKKLYFDKYQF